MWPGLGIVCGLQAEAKIVRHLTERVAVTGGRHDQAVTLSRSLIASGCDALLSFGIAGGLDPARRPGDVIVATAVTDGTASYRCAAGILDIEVRRSHAGVIFGSVSALNSESAKQMAFADTGALAVDMESLAVAQVAAAAGLPFAVLRAVADPAGRSLPPAALVGLDAAGRPAVWPVLASLARDPRQIADLVAVARATRTALRGLKRAVGML